MSVICRLSRLARPLPLQLALALVAAQLVLVPVALAQEAVKASPGPAPGSAGASLILAIDTSRSLSKNALADTVAKASQTLAALPPEVKVGVLAFDDNARWQVEPGSSAAEAQAKLSALSPQGNFTLLNDALFEATRRLEQGGVILLLTDGRDENSATTVEDIARRCEGQKVRILTVGIGARIDEKALRRLALLTRGDYLGKGLDAKSAAGAAGEALRRVQKDQEEERRRLELARPRPAALAPAAQPAGSLSAQPTSAQPTSQAAASPAGGAESTLLGYLPWILSALLALGFFIYVLMRQQAARRSAAEEIESLRSEEESQVADEADAAAIRLELAQVQVAQPRDSPEVTVDTAVLQRMTLDERLERTRVLSSMLILKKPGEAPRSFLLDHDKAFSVGREREKNTLAVPDPSLSSQHFRIVPRAGVYYFVDLESTNGSYIGSRKVRAKRLRTGDVIRAGQVEFEFQSYGPETF